jgi:hypothetical protein
MEKLNKKAWTSGALIIASAIIWGVVILGCSFALKGTECYGEIQNILVGGTFVHIILLGTPITMSIIKTKEKAKDK